MNRVVYILDASGSMSQRVKQTVALTKASIAKLPATDKVSLLTFEGSTVRVVFDKVAAKDVKFEATDYRIGGLTNLRDAVGDGCDLLAKRAGKADTYLVVVLTDGGENSSSRVSQKDLVALIRDCVRTDHWTFAFMVPPECVDETKKLGIDSSNIFAWTDIEHAAQALSGGMDNLTAARAAGKTALRAGFFADLSGAKKADVRAQMRDVSSIVQRAQVKKKETIKAFCLANFGKFTKGSCFYELIEPETVQGYKEVAVIDKRRPHEVFVGGRGILGLPDGDVRLKPGELGNYRVFIGSTSVNRNMDPGTEALYADGLAQITG